MSSYSYWFNKGEIASNQYNYDKLVEKLESCDVNLVTCTSENNHFITVEPETTCMIKIMLDPEYTVIKNIKFIFGSEVIQYGWIRGFTIDNYDSIEKILDACQIYMDDKTLSFDDRLAIACASSE
jgi:hypothetical protein